MKGSESDKDHPIFTAIYHGKKSDKIPRGTINSDTFQPFNSVNSPNSRPIPEIKEAWWVAVREFAKFLIETNLAHRVVPEP